MKTVNGIADTVICCCYRLVNGDTGLTVAATVNPDASARRNRQKRQVK